MIRFLIAILFLPATVFGTIAATDKGTGNNTVSSTTLNITMTSMTAGNTGVLVLAYDNATNAATNLANTTSYTDSVGNVWYVRANGFGGSANVNAEGAILTSRLTANTSSSNTLTITFTTATATNFCKAWTWTEVSTTAGNAVIQVNTFIAATASSTTASNVTPFISNNDLVIGAAMLETNAAITADSDTLNNSWSTAQTDKADTGLLTTSISVISQSKVVNASGAQTYNISLAGTTDMRIGYIYFTETDPNCRVAQFNSTATEATTTATFNFPIPLVASSAKSMGVLVIAADNNGTSGTSSNFPSTTTNDTQGNVWTKRQDAIYNISGVGTGVEVAVYTGDIQTSLAVGNTVSWTYTTAGVTAKAWAIWEFAPTSSSGAMTFVSGANGTGATTTSPTITTTSITNGDYVIGVVGQEGTNSLVQDSGTTNGTWKTALTTGNGTGATAMSIITQWKKVTATATQIYNPTCSSQDTVAAWISVHDSSPSGLTTAQKSGFFMLFP